MTVLLVIQMRYVIQISNYNKLTFILVSDEVPYNLALNAFRHFVIDIIVKAVGSQNLTLMILTWKSRM